MGQFSWDCHVCGASLHHAWKGPKERNAWQMKALLFAANGFMAEGDYDGYGRIGDFQIPKEWMFDDVTFWTHMAEEADRNAIQADETFALFEETDRLLGRPPGSHRILNGDHYREAAARDREYLEKARQESVDFTVYHRRCWKKAGKPGFQGRSRMSEDQGR